MSLRVTGLTPGQAVRAIGARLQQTRHSTPVKGAASNQSQRYCFFTRILPLIDWSSTEDEPELEVPAKERPWTGGLIWCCFSCKGNSLSTEPVRERAERSTEAEAGSHISMSPL